MQRIIIHSDMNSCYASIECSLNPALKGKPVAVAGKQEDRHGIILAKSAEAKVCGVKTGEAIWQAQQKCPDLILISPHFDVYMKYSALAHDIYARYTDRIEPMGLDEVWCDLTGSTLAFGGAEKIVREIREAFKNELGLTVSVGLSYNKIFAKLGSDLAGNDEVFRITRENYRDTVWPLPVESIMGVGRNTAKKLHSYGIKTIGELAACEEKWLHLVFGVIGDDLWRYANGLDDSPVMPDGYSPPIKSIGHGATCRADLVSPEEVWKAFLSLSQDVSRRLKKAGLEACGVQISVKDNRLMSRQYQCELPMPTASALALARTAAELFRKNYTWNYDVRALTVRAIHLQNEGMPLQLDLSNDYKKSEKQKKIDDTVLFLRERYGEKIIMNCCLMNENKCSSDSPLPGIKHR
ncbi:MAG: DNA polymerase IV [Oscillospiraceae bacterium]|nr:DNA polymerase IV [Oscillospiraceae bacterium]